MRKIIIKISLLFIITSLFTSCGNKKASEESITTEVIKIGATSIPHAKILESAKKELEKKGITLEIVEYPNWEQLNQDLNDGKLDANYFQHEEYLLQESKEKEFDLVSLGGVHFEPLGMYSNKYVSIEAGVNDGAVVAIPNDESNGIRALKFLEDNMLIELGSTPSTVKNNPYNLDIQTKPADTLFNELDNVDFAIINGNFVIAEGVYPLTSAIIIENRNSMYDNIVAVKEGSQDEEKYKLLMEALTSDSFQDSLSSKFQGSLVAIRAR